MPNPILNENAESTSGVEDNYFENLNEDFDVDPDASSVEDGGEEFDAAPGVPTTEPEPAVDEPAAPAPATAPAEPTAPQPAPAPLNTAPSPAPAAPTTATAPQVFDMEAYAAEHLPRLEKLYAFTEEEATQLQTEPELVMPKLAARLHLRIVQDALSGISAVLPQIIQQQQTAAEAERSSWDNFYSVNGDIRGKVTQDQILSVAGMYKQINPTAAPEQVITEVGRIIRTSLGLPETQSASTNAAPANSPTPTQQPAPFTPARGSGLGSQVKPNNLWTSLAEELDEF